MSREERKKREVDTELQRVMESTVQPAECQAFVYTDVSNQRSIGGLSLAASVYQNHHKFIHLQFNFTEMHLTSRVCIYLKRL